MEDWKKKTKQKQQKKNKKKKRTAVYNANMSFWAGSSL